MKFVKILVILVVVVVLLVGGALFMANRYVQSPEFKDTIASAATKALGSEVKFEEMQASLFEGVTLRGVTIANPPGFEGNLLTAGRFILRYDLMPLLRRQVHIQKLAVKKPVITLAKNEKGEWNYEKIGGSSTAAPSGTSAPAGTTTPTTSPLDIALSNLGLQNGEVIMLGEKAKMLIDLKDIDLSTDVNLVGDKLTGKGQASIATINVAESLFIQKVVAPVALSSAEVKLAPLQGTLAGGAVSGDLTLKIAGGAKYVVNIAVKEGDVAQMLKEAKTKEVLTGKLQATANLEGTGGLPTINGGGKAEITGGKLMEIPILNIVAALLQMPELVGLQFQECVLEFTIANNVMQTPVIRVTAPNVRITGKGSVGLEDYALNHEITLAVNKSALDRLPKEVRGIFRDTGEGFAGIDFKVWGPYDKPKTDLQERLVKGAAGSLLNEGLKKLFK